MTARYFYAGNDQNISIMTYSKNIVLVFHIEEIKHISIQSKDITQLETDRVLQPKSLGLRQKII